RGNRGLEKMPPSNPLDHYNLACYHALLTRRFRTSRRAAFSTSTLRVLKQRLSSFAGQADSGMTDAEGQAEDSRAMTALCGALAAGFFMVDLIRTDTDLDPLRSRPDFQTLLRDLAMPDDPFAH